tara:strand:+ start:55 stop:843 length:789 start_codon:yes stop_codon:yes gene_type:complete
MNLKVNTRFEELCLEVTVKTLLPAKIRIKVYDYSKPNTVFTDRFKTVKGTEIFYVRLPLSSDNVVISVYNEANGNRRINEDSTFNVTGVQKIPLEKRMDAKDLGNIVVRNFVDFAQRFAYNASYLEASQSYQSQDGKFLIQYEDTLFSDKTGKELTTPARISKVNGRIQISKSLFKDYTVPMRMTILLHEFSHFYLNDNMDDESEADLNGLLIYLSLGYPRIEGYEAFLEVFMDAPSAQNQQRYQVIDKFIRDFEAKKILIK